MSRDTGPKNCCHGDCMQGRDCPIRETEIEIEATTTEFFGVIFIAIALVIGCLLVSRFVFTNV